MKLIRNNKILNNMIWLLLDKIIVLIVGLIVLVKIANYYGPTEYGIYQYALSINVILGIIVLFIDGRVVKKSYLHNNQAEVIYNTTIAKTILSAVSLFIGLIMIIFINKESKFNIIFIVLLLNNVIVNMTFGIQNYFEYRLKSKNVVISANIATLISLCTQLILVYFNYSIIYIAFAVLVSSIIKLIIMAIQFNLVFRIKFLSKINYHYIFNILVESFPLAIAASASTIYHRVDQVMLGSMLGSTEVGIYSISIKILSILTLAIVPLQVSIFPKMIDLYESNKKKYYDLYLGITSFSTWLYIVGTLISFFLVRFVINNFLSFEYRQSLSTFYVLMFSGFFLYNAILRSSHLTLIRNTHILLISQVISVMINIILNYILIPLRGIYGAAIATVITEFFSLFLLNVLFAKGREVFIIQLKSFNPYSFISLYRYIKKNES